MVKIFKSGLFLFLFISVLNDGLAQKITLGASLRYPVFASLPSFDEKVFLFADDVNSIYAVRPEKGLKPRSLLFPEICGRYLFNDNIFIRYELGYLSYLKTVNINYNSRFHDNLNYEYSFDYSYLTNHFSAGYRFFRAKEVRFELSAGICNYYLTRFKEVSRKDESLLLINQYPYGQIIHRNFSTITNNFFAYSLSGRVEYYLFTVTVSYQGSFTGLNETGDNYKNYNALYVSAGINLFNFLVENKKIVKLKKD